MSKVFIHLVSVYNSPTKIICFIVILFKEPIADLWLFVLIGSLSVLVLIVSAYWSLLTEKKFIKQPKMHIFHKILGIIYSLGAAFIATILIIGIILDRIIIGCD